MAKSVLYQDLFWEDPEADHKPTQFITFRNKEIKIPRVLTLHRSNFIPRYLTSQNLCILGFILYLIRCSRQSQVSTIHVQQTIEFCKYAHDSSLPRALHALRDDWEDNGEKFLDVIEEYADLFTNKEQDILLDLAENLENKEFRKFIHSYAFAGTKQCITDSKEDLEHSVKVALSRMMSYFGLVLDGRNISKPKNHEERTITAKTETTKEVYIYATFSEIPTLYELMQNRNSICIVQKPSLFAIFFPSHGKDCHSNYFAGPEWRECYLGYLTQEPSIIKNINVGDFIDNLFAVSK